MVASTAMLTHNILKTGTPRNIYSGMVSEYPYRTRQSTNGEIRLTASNDSNSSFTERTFKYQSRKYYNQIPAEIRAMSKQQFKNNVTKWVKENIPIR